MRDSARKNAFGKSTARCLRCRRNRMHPQSLFSPSSPPLAPSSKGRVNQLKSLGNAVCPPQVYPVLEAIARLERERNTSQT